MNPAGIGFNCLFQPSIKKPHSKNEWGFFIEMVEAGSIELIS
jgi:hypothetical protein